MATITMNGKRYSTHAEVLNQLFGKHYKLFLPAACKIGNGYSVWFPVVSRTPNKNSLAVKTADNGWINLLIKNDDEIHQYWPDPAHTEDLKHSQEKRITFAKFSSGSTCWYEFIGVYEIDKSMTAPDHTVYKRIARQYQ